MAQGAGSGAHWLAGCDETPGIVAVAADAAGGARVWRRTSPDRVEVTDHRFPNWFLTNSLELIGHLPARRVPVEELRAAHGRLAVPEGLGLVELEGGDAEAYRYLVLTDDLAGIEPALLDTYNKRVNGQAQRLAELRGAVLIWPPVEQFLLLSGRTYYKGLEFADLRRLQFDLETTGLNEHTDRVFMVCLRDSAGWRACLDTASLSEAELIERFVRLVRERDPDVLENHNIFAFDLPFLVRRAASLGVRLALGRDGSEPRLVTDLFHTGERGEPFARWTVAGREVIDTLQAVKRYGATAPALRRHGLKDAARYFGFARPDREYVPGAEVWATFRRDPERVRRYASDDVDEADGLSRRLLPGPFALASLLPRPYERVAADASPQGVLEPLLARAYLHEGQALPAVGPEEAARSPAARRARLFVRGVVQNAARVAVTPLFARALAAGAAGGGAGPPLRLARDELGALPALVAGLLAREAEHRAASEDERLPAEERARHAARAAALEGLAQASESYLASPGLPFADPRAAAEIQRGCRRVLDQLLGELRRRAARVVEVDGEQVLFEAPAGWDAAAERALAVAARAFLPAGVRLQDRGRFRAVYARAARSHILLGYDGSVTVAGNAFRPGKRERFGEAFVHQAAPLVLTGDAAGLRRLFLETVARLRGQLVALDELCAQAVLFKSPAEYRRSAYQEEPYEALLAAGVKSWRVGQRVRYFRDRTGSPRLLREGDGTPAAAADAEHYVERLCAVYCQLFAHAFRPEDAALIFGLPGDAGSAGGAELAAIRPIAVPVTGRPAAKREGVGAFDRPPARV